jgi:hypothetical protein
MCDEPSTSCCNVDDDGAAAKASSVDIDVYNCKLLQYENDQEEGSSKGSDTSEYGLDLSPSSSSDHSPMASKD